MISGWAIAIVLPAVLLALADWRKGMFALVFVAFLQDPARKVVEGQPVYFTVLVGVALGFVFLRAQMESRLWLDRITGWSEFVGTPFILLLLVVVVQGLQSAILHGNLVIVGIGALSYLAPFPALLLGYQYAIREGQRGILRWLAWYLTLALIVLPSILLEYLGFESSLLGSVGEGFMMYTEDWALRANSGLFRAAETAAWHAASCVCLLVLLASLKKLSTLKIAFAVAIGVALLAIALVTGRRKVFVEVAIFLACYSSLLVLLGKGGMRLAITIFVTSLLCFGLMTWWAGTTFDASLGPSLLQSYVGRGGSVGSDVGERFIDLGLGPILWAIGDFGWLGGGLGVASQGAQHFGAGADVYGGSGEGGLGKITAELGVPGLAIAIWLAVAAVRYGWSVIRFVSRRSAATTRLAVGLASILIANLSVFLVATQVFGDIFVLTILGLVTGFFLATPTLAARVSAQPVGFARSAANAKPAMAMTRRGVQGVRGT